MGNNLITKASWSNNNNWKRLTKSGVVAAISTHIYTKRKHTKHIFAVQILSSQGFPFHLSSLFLFFSSSCSPWSWPRQLPQQHIAPDTNQPAPFGHLPVRESSENIPSCTRPCLGSSCAIRSQSQTCR